MPTSIETTTGRGYTLHSVYMSGQPLGVECRGCGHRALAFAGELERLKGDMIELRTLRFVCRACGSRAWSGWLLSNDLERNGFIGALAGGPTF